MLKTPFLKSIVVFSTWLIIMTSTSNVQADTLKVGQSAPNFTLNNQNHNPISLSDYRGKWVVLYFYPKDDTPGCTAEACSFRDNINHLIAQKAVILAVSVDNPDSHQAFSKKYKLPFDLLADKDGLVAKQYDSLLNLIFMKIAKRHTFIIDPKGKIVKIYTDVDPKEHVRIVLNDLKQLQAETKD